MFEKFIKVSVKEYGDNPLYCVSFPRFTWQCGLKCTGINFQTLQDKYMILLLENNIPCGISSVMGDRYDESDENKKILYIDATNIYGYSMSQTLPYDEIEFHKNFRWEGILSTPDDNDIDYFIEVEVVLTYPDNIKEKTKDFPFVPENRKYNPDDLSEYMKEIIPVTYT